MTEELIKKTGFEIETIEVVGFATAFTALRKSYGKDTRSDILVSHSQNESIIATASRVDINEKDLALAMRLINTGDDHAKALRGILVSTRITAAQDWWRQLETYRAGHERVMSSSKMHGKYSKLNAEELLEVRRNTSVMELTEAVDWFSYQCLRNIYHSRKTHRLPEWHAFCEWIETLPFFSELILGKIPEDHVDIEAIVNECSKNG